MIRDVYENVYEYTGMYTGCEVRNTRYEVDHEIRDGWYVVRGTRYENVYENMYTKYVYKEMYARYEDTCTRYMVRGTWCICICIRDVEYEEEGGEGERRE